jgi:hypothetical protein
VESTTAGVCSVQQLSRVEKRIACETSLWLRCQKLFDASATHRTIVPAAAPRTDGDVRIPGHTNTTVVTWLQSISFQSTRQPVHCTPRSAGLPSCPSHCLSAANETRQPGEQFVPLSAWWYYLGDRSSMHVAAASSAQRSCLSRASPAMRRVDHTSEIFFLSAPPASAWRRRRARGRVETRLRGMPGRCFCLHHMTC